MVDRHERDEYIPVHHICLVSYYHITWLLLVLLFIFEIGSHYVTQASLKLPILLPQSRRC